MAGSPPQGMALQMISPASRLSAITFSMRLNSACAFSSCSLAEAYLSMSLAFIESKSLPVSVICLSSRFTFAIYRATMNSSGPTVCPTLASSPYSLFLSSVSFSHFVCKNYSSASRPAWVSQPLLISSEASRLSSLSLRVSFSLSLPEPAAALRQTEQQAARRCLQIHTGVRSTKRLDGSHD